MDSYIEAEKEGEDEENVVPAAFLLSLKHVSFFTCKLVFFSSLSLSFQQILNSLYPTPCVMYRITHRSPHAALCFHEKDMYLVQILHSVCVL